MQESTRPSATLRVLGRVFRLSLGLGLTAWLLVQADPAQVLASFTRATPGWMIAAVGLVLIDRVLMACRWLLLLRAIEPGKDIPLGAVMRIFFVSTFLGTFLPASVGGDAVRTIGLARLQVPAADALASVVVDRILGILSVLVMATGGLLVVRQILDASSLAAIAAVLIVAVSGSLLLLFDSRILEQTVRWMTARRLPTVERLATKLLGAIRQFGAHRRALAIVLAASIAVQILRTIQAWCLGMALGLPVNIVWYFAFIPLVILAMALPITVAGLGTSQLSFQLLFALVGVADADALALSVLFLALGAFGNLPGGWLVMFGGTGNGTQPAPASRAVR